jgi:hypothetical protein
MGEPKNQNRIHSALCQNLFRVLANAPVALESYGAGWWNP